MRQGVEIENRVLGPEHNLTIGAKENLAITLDQEGKYAEAEKLEREVLNIRRRVAGAERRTPFGPCLIWARLLHIGANTEKPRRWNEKHSTFSAASLGGSIRIPLLRYTTWRALPHIRGDVASHAFTSPRSVDDHLDVETMLGMEKEPELKSLHGDPRFEALIERAGQLTAAATKPQ